MNAGLLQGIETRRRLYRLFRRRKTLEAKLAYETYNIRLRRLLRRTKDDFYKSRIAGTDGDPLAAWRYVNSYIRGRSGDGGIDPLLVNKSVDDINRYFALLGRNTVLSKMLPPGVSSCL